jgi:hypothetical protein
MRTLLGRADEHGDGLAIAISLAPALTLGAMRSVADDVAATRMDPEAVDAGAPPTAPGLEPGPLWPAAPYS